MTMTFVQACIWNTFGPITYSVQLAYGWSDSTVALLSNWGAITYVALVIPYTFLFQKLGARYTVVLGTFVVAGGTSLRTLTKDDPPLLILCHLGQLLNGASGVIVMSLPGLISAIWFPEGERIFATALGQVSVYVNVPGLLLLLLCCHSFLSKFFL